MLCIKCGKEIPEGSAYCNWCGKKQTSRAAPRQRANGEGSVYRMPNGKWRAQITLGYKLSEDGLRKVRESASKSGFRTKADARDYIEQLRKQTVQRHNYDITLKALYDEWLPTHQKSKSTMDCYISGFKVFRDLWEVPMSEQDIDDLQECLDECGKGRRTQENARAALGLVYKYGIPRNCVPHDRNLAQFLKVCRTAEQRTMGLNDIELEKIRRRAEAGDHIAAMVYCHCYLGFRPSAFLDLRIENYNPAEHAILGGIKTEAGKDRTVTISPKIQKYFDSAIGSRSSGTVFADLSLEDYREEFYSLLDRCGIDNPLSEDGRHRLTPHSCRHTFATLIKRVPGTDKDKLELMGHTSIEMLGKYQDVSFEDLRKITDKI